MSHVSTIDNVSTVDISPSEFLHLNVKGVTLFFFFFEREETFAAAAQEWAPDKMHESL